MQSTQKRILVFDLETGGLNHKVNPITEMAGVVVSVETLEIIEEFSVVFQPRLDLSWMQENSRKEAKEIFAALSEKDEETNIKTIKYKGISVTPKSIDVIISDIELFQDFMNQRTNSNKISGHIISYAEYLDLQKTGLKDISKLYFDCCYNPQALEVTHMSIDLLIKEGVTYEEAFDKIKDLIERNTVGNSKPILSGHNIRSFDIPFMKKVFEENNSNFESLLNNFLIDTLEWARLRWFELPNFSLSTCANALGLTLKEAHRALPDTIANANVLIAMLKSMRGEGQGTEEKEYKRKKFNLNF